MNSAAAGPVIAGVLGGWLLMALLWITLTLLVPGSELDQLLRALGDLPGRFWQFVQVNLRGSVWPFAAVLLVYTRQFRKLDQLLANTDSSFTRVVRGDPASPEIITADLKSLIEEGNLSQNLVLASGDMVYVPRSGWGDINLYNKRIRPLFELIIWPARTVIDWYTASDLISTGGYRND